MQQLGREIEQGPRRAGRPGGGGVEAGQSGVEAVDAVGHRGRLVQKPGDRRSQRFGADQAQDLLCLAPRGENPPQHLAQSRTVQSGRSCGQKILEGFGFTAQVNGNAL